MTKFRPCIDLHNGKVKQIVGSTLSENQSQLKVNHVSEKSAVEFAELYARDSLLGGHLIMLGEGNQVAALAAINAYPNGLQVGGGISTKNAARWIEAGASHVIVTSCIFDDNGMFNLTKLKELEAEVGKANIVIDLSCKKRKSNWVVMKDRWRTETNLSIDKTTLEILSDYCDEFLIHATDLEGRCGGIDGELVKFLSHYSPLKATYAGGVTSLKDLDYVKAISSASVDVTIGSGLDLFGGKLIKYKDCVFWNNNN